MKKPPTTFIYKNAMTLRPISPNDGRAIYQAAQNSLPELKKFMFWAHFGGGYEIAKKFYAQFEKDTQEGKEAHFAAFDMKTNEFLFCCSLTPDSHLNPFAFSIGYWVASKHCGQGYGTLAAQLMIAVGFIYYEADRLAVIYNPENIPSLRIIEKFGFQFEGKLRNYSQKPTPEMIQNGYSKECDMRNFSLLLKDLTTVSWYEPLTQKLELRG